MKHKLKNSQGFSIIEVLIFAIIISIVFVGGVTVVITNLRRTKFNQHKAIANHLAEEGIEWVRGVEETSTGFNDINTKAFDTTGKAYCMPAADIVNFNLSGASFGASLANVADVCTATVDAAENRLYKRTIRLVQDSGSISGGQVNVEVEVDWTEGVAAYNVKGKTILTIADQN